MRKLLAPEVEDHGWQRSAAMPPDPPAHGGEHSCRCAQLGASAGAGGAAKGVRAPAERPQNMPITPHESIAGHRFSYNRHERHCGGVVAQDLSDRPPQVQLARSWPAHAVPRSSPLFAPCPRSTWVNLRTARQVVKPNVEELRARPAHKNHRSGAGARDAGRPDPQLWNTEYCGAGVHTLKHPRTEMPAVGSHATCAAALPSGSPPDPS